LSCVQGSNSSCFLDHLLPQKENIWKYISTILMYVRCICIVYCLDQTTLNIYINNKFVYHKLTNLLLFNLKVSLPEDDAYALKPVGVFMLWKFIFNIYDVHWLV
jgi:hypothetical protein